MAFAGSNYPPREEYHEDLAICKALNPPQVFLSWKHLSVKVHDSKGGIRYLLQKVTGYAEPGGLLAIMGPSGCGKTTLLNTLAGRLDSSYMISGQVLANGRRQQLSYGKSAYVTQDSALIATLTVYETMVYAAHLQLPGRMSKAEKEQRVQASIQGMGLHECAHTKVGGWHVRGLSGGEKRRLSIAVETIQQPQLLFLDEPTSGLDSAAAFYVVTTLKALSKGGRTVILSIHQPASEVFGVFDFLCLLSGGRAVYFGETRTAQQFFDDAGLCCPAFRNPSDHFLWVINSEFDQVYQQDMEIEDASKSNTSTAQKVELLVKAYAESDLKRSAILRIDQATHKGGDLLKSAGRDAPNLFKQAFYLTLRSFTNMRRDFSYYWFRLFVYLLLSILVGSVYYKVGLSYTAIQARAVLLMYVTAFLTFMGVMSFPSFVQDMKMFTRERLNGHYGVAAFVIANTLSSLPFLTLMSLLPAATIYTMTGLHPGLSHFAFFFITTLASLSTAEGLLMAIVSVVPDFLSGMIFGCGVMGVFLLTGGFFRLFSDLPKPVWRYPLSYMSFHTWANKALYNNDFLGLSFENCIVPGGPPIPGEMIVDMFEMRIPCSKWWTTLVLMGMAITYRMLFFFVIKLRERLPTFVRKSRRFIMRRRDNSGRLVAPHDGELLDLDPK